LGDLAGFEKKFQKNNLTKKLLKGIIIIVVNKRSYDPRIIRNAIMANVDFENKLLKRFNTLISLMLDIASTENAVSVTKKVDRLLSLGLSPAEIGEILGKPTNYVTAIMHSKKKKVKKKG